MNDFYKFQINSNNVLTQNNQKTNEKSLNIINRTEGICIKNKTKTNQKVPKKQKEKTLTKFHVKEVSVPETNHTCNLKSE